MEQSRRMRILGHAGAALVVEVKVADAATIGAHLSVIVGAGCRISCLEVECLAWEYLLIGEYLQGKETDRKNLGPHLD